MSIVTLVVVSVYMVLFIDPTQGCIFTVHVHLTDTSIRVCTPYSNPCSTSNPNAYPGTLHRVINTPICNGVLHVLFTTQPNNAN
jgi:hypothetical protein